MLALTAKKDDELPQPSPIRQAPGISAYLECEPGPDLIGKNLGYHPVEGRKNLHRQLRFDSALVNQIIERIGKR